MPVLFTVIRQGKAQSALNASTPWGKQAEKSWCCNLEINSSIIARTLGCFGFEFYWSPVRGCWRDWVVLGCGLELRTLFMGSLFCSSIQSVGACCSRRLKKLCNFKEHDSVSKIYYFKLLQVLWNLS